MSDKDETPLTENLADIAAGEGVTDAPPAKKKRGRPPNPENVGKVRNRSAEYKARYERDKAKAGAGHPGAPSTPKTEAPKIEIEMPFTKEELRDAMNQAGAALFALPGEFLATRRPDLAEKLQLGPEEAVFGGKAVNYYVMSRFPDIMEKWGPEAMLFGAVAIFYGPRLIMMAKTPKPQEPGASIDGKPAPIRAVQTS